MRGRKPLAIGQHGNVSTSGSGDKVLASCYYRDIDGVTRRVRAVGTSTAGAKANLQIKLKARRLVGGEELGPESKLSELAEAWFKTVNQSQSTKDAYRYYLDKHIIPSIGKVRVREATTARLDTFLRESAAKGSAVGKQCRVVLSLMFGLASRYDIVPVNPVTDTKLPSVKRQKVKALTIEQIFELRSDVAEWATGKPNRAVMLDAVDLFISTGLRPGELLALRFSDIDLERHLLAVTGTIKRDSKNGLHRQEWPKTENGFRILTLPSFAVEVLRRRSAAATSELVFPNRNGEPIEPANFRRTWREVRGEKWVQVEPRSFRRAVATLIERESGSVVASQQLGHSSDAVTRKHYIERSVVAPDSSRALERFVTRADDEVVNRHQNYSASE